MLLLFPERKEESRSVCWLTLSCAKGYRGPEGKAPMWRSEFVSSTCVVELKLCLLAQVRSTLP